MIISNCPKLRNFLFDVAIVDIDFVEFEQFLKTRNQLKLGRVGYTDGGSKVFRYQR